MNNNEYNTLIELIKSQNQMIINRLDKIENQTTKTNGRVNKLELSVNDLQNIDNQHKMQCPHNQRFEALENYVNKNKNIKKFILATISLTGVMLGIIYSVIQILSKS